MAQYYVTVKQAREIADALLEKSSIKNSALPGLPVPFENGIPEVKFATLPDDGGDQEVISIQIVRDRHVGVIWP